MKRRGEWEDSVKIVNQADFATGALYVAFGTAVAIGSLAYEVGSASRMGPGYFPLATGIALAFIGVIVLLGAPGRDENITRSKSWPLKNVGLILLAVALFGLSLETLGLIFALPLLVAVSAWAHPEFSIRTTVVSILFQLVFVEIVFVMLLGIQIPLIPPFLLD